MKRHEYIVRSTVDVFKKVSNKEHEVKEDDVDEERKIHLELKEKANKDNAGGPHIQFGNGVIEELTEEEEERLDRMHLIRTEKFKARPVYKIFNTFLEPQEIQALQESMD